jgi:hypothetical protein
MSAAARPQPTQRCLPNPCAFHSYASHLRFDAVSTGHFAQTVTDLGRLGLAATATAFLHYFSFTIFFFIKPVMKRIRA